MQKISRVHVSNYGAHNAWFDALTFELTDPDTRHPCDVVINLENGGGKTTLLGFIFSCFETRQEKFLKHMQDRNHRFSEYFSKDGVPGFILMEWMMPPKFAAGEPYKLVLGQVVAIKSAAEREDIERHFFAFEATPKFTFESIPAPGLSSGAPAQSMAEVLRWMHSAERIVSDFFHTRIQDDWQKHLATRSVDVDMLRLQVEFSAQEGGIDASFLTFHNEADFLRKFFTLILDAEKCAAVRQVVVGACDTLRQKPLLDRRLSELTRLSATMKPFVDTAEVYEQARAERAAMERSAAGLRVALLARAVSDEAAMGAHAQEAEAQERKMTACTRRASDSNARAATLRLLQLERALYDTEATHKQAEREVDQCERKLRTIRGAQALVQVKETEARLAELQSFEEAEREGLRPARMQAEIQGALLRFALQREENRLSEVARANQAQEADARDKLTEAKAALDQLGERVAGLNRTQATLVRDEERFVEVRDRLRNHGLLLPLEGVSKPAISRLEEALAATRNAVIQANDAESRFLDAERSHRAAAEAARRDSEGRLREKTHLETFVAKGDAERERLSQLRVLRTAIEADLVDPDSPAVLTALESLQSSDAAAIATGNVRIAELESNSKAIELTGVAGQSRDVEEVVAKLLSLGIRSARPFNTYLADAIDDAARSRALVLRDPARFLGVAVASAELGHAKDVLASVSLKLSKPVVVTEVALESIPKHGDYIVLGPEDDAGYNRKAARLYAQRLDKALGEARSELQAYRARSEEASAAKEQLRSYSESYGHGQMNRARADADRFAYEAVAAAERATQADASAEAAKTEAKSAKDRTARLASECSDAENNLRRLREFRDEHETPRMGRLESLKAIERDLNEAEQERTALRAHAEQAENEQKIAYEARVRAESTNARIREERASIMLYEAKYPAEQALTARPQTLEVLRGFYSDAKSTLETKERERLGVLAEKLRVAREAAESAAKHFAEKYADLNTDELHQLRAENFDTAIARQDKAVSEARVKERDVREKHTEAATRLKMFRQQNSKVAPASTEMQILKDSELIRHIERSEQEAERARADSEGAKAAATEARTKQARAQGSAQQATGLAETLRVALSIPDQMGDVPQLELAADVSAQVNSAIEEATQHRTKLDDTRRKAQKAFSNLARAASAPQFHEAEPELSLLLSSNEFDAACADRVRLAEGLAERISTTEESIGRMKEDFESCVVELSVLANMGIQSLTSATAGKRVPEGAPYVGGKPVLKMRANFSHVSNEVRREALRKYLDSLIETAVIPEKGAHLVAECALRMHGKPLGLHVLKMVPDEDQQYVAIDQLKNSGGEGVTMAMFLYLVINQLRAETHAKLKKAGGGPLILDNPFAKATTPTLWRAQRLLAEAMDVQLIFATALPDYNTLGEFRRFIRLRKAGKNQKTGRWHLEHADLALLERAEQYA